MDANTFLYGATTTTTTTTITPTTTTNNSWDFGDFLGDIINNNHNNLSSATSTGAAVTAGTTTSITTVHELRKSLNEVDKYVSTPVIVFGIFCNILTLLTLRDPELKKAPYSYLTALAVADLSALLLALSLYITKFLEMYIDEASYEYCWYKTTFYYPLINLATTTGTLVMTTMTIERCLFIKFPFWVLAHKSRARFKIGCVFIVNFIINFPRFLWYYPILKSEVMSGSSSNSSSSGNSSSSISSSSSGVHNSSGGSSNSSFSSSSVSEVNAAAILASSSSSSSLSLSAHVDRNSSTPGAGASTEYIIWPHYHGTHFALVVSWIHSVVLHCLPVVSLILLNAFIIYKFRFEHRRRSELGISNTMATVWGREQTRLTYTYSIITIVFIVLIMPSAFSDENISKAVFGVNRQTPSIVILQFVSNFLVCVNLSVNFLMYTFINVKFTRAFKTMLLRWRMRVRRASHAHFLLSCCCCCCCCCWRRGRGEGGGVGGGCCCAESMRREQFKMTLAASEERVPFNNNKKNNHAGLHRPCGHVMLSGNGTSFTTLEDSRSEVI